MNSSMLLAIVLDYVRRIRLTFCGMLAGLVLTPLALHALIAVKLGISMWEGLDTVLFHSSFFLMSALAFGSAASTAHAGTRERLFRLPVSTKALVAWQMLSMAVTVIVGTLLALFLLKLFFPIDWPWVAATAFVAVVSILSLSCFWTIERFGFRRFAVAVSVWIAFVFWFLRRYFPDGFSEQKQLWAAATPGEWGVMAVVAVVAWISGVHAMSQLRCGDAEVSEAARRFADWVCRLSDLGLSGRSEVASSESADRWYQWRFRTGPLLWSAGIGIGVFLLLVSPGIDNPQPGRQLEGLQVMFTMFPAMGGMFVGVAMGVMGNDAKSEVMPSFLAVRPLSTRDLAGRQLSSLFRTTLLVWLANVGIGSLYLVWKQVFGDGAFHERAFEGSLFDRVGSFTLPVALLLSFLVTWTASGVTASIAWLGRPVVSTILICTFIIGAIVVLFLFRVLMPWLWDSETARLTLHTGCALLAFVPVLVFGGLAGRRRLLRPVQFSVVHAGWLAIGIGTWFLLPWSPAHRCCFVLLLSVIVLPFSAAPLALAANRHR